MVMAKSRENRLTFATWLMFFRDHGRFPRGPSDLESLDIAALARQIEVTVPADGGLLLAERTANRLRTETLATLCGFSAVSFRFPLQTGSFKCGMRSHRLQFPLRVRTVNLVGSDIVTSMISASTPGRAEGYSMRDEDVAWLSPLIHE